MARADVSTERPGSILIFPKVIADGTRDTIIQITNTRTTIVHARCFYIDGSIDPSTLQPRWQESDFSIWLTKLQPTHWQVSQGRRVDSSDNSPGTASFPLGAGLDPGAVPPVTAGFTGQLLCAEVDSSDKPIAYNSLKGEATIQNSASGDVSKYNAIGIQGIDPADPATPLNDLALDNVEYNGCPAALQFGLMTEGTADPVVETLGNAGSSVANYLTMIPCTQDLENMAASTVPVYFDVWDEYEGHLSSLVNVTCWRQLSLAETAPAGAFAGRVTTFLSARITPRTQVGVLGVASSVVTDGTGLNSASVDVSLNLLGNDDLTNLPNQVGTPGSVAVIRLAAP
ncbi:MAG: hypothetical protein HY699_06715 [Deltaproteobacteria bacterium]|nr:hypothetical protein [Deltaproteobacteria bacterium]